MVVCVGSYAIIELARRAVVWWLLHRASPATFTRLWRLYDVLEVKWRGDFPR